MPFVQADIDALDAAYKAGTKSVRLADGREVVYRDVTEYERLRAIMAGDVADASSTPTLRRLQVGTSRGLGW